jgi:hypothetical protein
VLASFAASSISSAGADCVPQSQKITDIVVVWSAAILMGIVLQVVRRILEGGSAFSQT